MKSEMKEKEEEKEKEKEKKRDRKKKLMREWREKKFKIIPSPLFSFMCILVHRSSHEAFSVCLSTTHDLILAINLKVIILGDLNLPDVDWYSNPYCCSSFNSPTRNNNILDVVCCNDASLIS